MNLIFLGAPGSGKGTAASRISKLIGVPHISTGDIFRANISTGTELGKLAQKYISEGQLVPDDVTVAIVRSRLEEPDCKNGFILDGFPRTISQAEALDKILAESRRKITRVIELDVGKEELICRLSNRRLCTQCKLTYTVNPEEPTAVCPVCGGTLILREDDKPEVIEQRLISYHNETEPLVKYYRRRRKLKSLKTGNNTVEQTFQEVKEALGIKDKEADN